MSSLREGPLSLAPYSPEEARLNTGLDLCPECFSWAFLHWGECFLSLNCNAKKPQNCACENQKHSFTQQIHACACPVPDAQKVLERQ